MKTPDTNFDPAAQLRGHVERMLIRGQCFPPDMIEILRLTRLIIKQENWRKQYPTLSLYCDWVQHEEIDRNAHACVILEKINEILVDLGDGDISAINREISRAFHLVPLRQEMLLLFMSKSIRTDIVDSLSNWRGFLGAVLDDISRRPLRMPDNADSKAAFDRMVNRNKSKGIRIDAVPRALYIINRSNEAGEPGRPPGFYWHVRLIEQGDHGEYYAALDGALLYTETGADFARP
jgi:hypothetical protein